MNPNNALILKETLTQIKDLEAQILESNRVLDGLKYLYQKVKDQSVSYFDVKVKGLTDSEVKNYILKGLAEDMETQKQKNLAATNKLMFVLKIDTDK